RAAWEGSLPVAAAVPVRIEAAALAGAPVYFQVVYPWTRPTRLAPAEPTGVRRFAINTNIGALVFALVCAGWLAWRNLENGRGDRRGAMRVGLGIVVSVVAGWALTANHQPSLQYEWRSFVLGASLALFVGGL